MEYSKKIMLQKQHKYHVSTLKPLPLSGFLYRKAGLICYRRGSAIFLRDFIKADWLAENAGTNIDQRERFYLKKPDEQLSDLNEAKCR
jgi:hypothetical protein